MTSSKSLRHTDVVTTEDLQELAAHDGPCVSVFLPTARHGPDTLEGPVRLKNLLRHAATDLEESGVDQATANTILEPLRALVDDAPFWQHQSDGLALYASTALSRYFRVPLAFAESAVTGFRFRLVPLWRLAAGDDTFFIVSLSQNEVRVFEATRQTIEEVALGPIPGSLADALAHEDPERQLQSHSVGGTDVQFHGQDAENDKETLERYFRAIDEGLNTVLGSNRQPVVLACVGYYLPIFQSITRLANLAETVIEGNPEHRTPAELLAAARAIIDPIQAARRTANADRFASLVGTGRTLTNLADIVTAAHEGRVEVLLIRTENPEPATQGPAVTNKLIDLAVADVLAKGGKIESLDHTLPADTPIATILRY
jgi:hypothetical protein